MVVVRHDTNFAPITPIDHVYRKAYCMLDPPTEKIREYTARCVITLPGIVAKRLHRGEHHEPLGLSVFRGQGQICQPSDLRFEWVYEIPLFHSFDATIPQNQRRMNHPVHLTPPSFDRGKR